MTRPGLATMLWGACTLAACRSSSPSVAPATPRVLVPERVASPHCAPTRGVALQVLGSGGPIPDDGRASASYLLWVDGRARLLLEAGGGSFLRFGEAGAKLEDLDAIALTHLHTDHSADLPALLKGSYFSARRRDLPVVGPSGNAPFPGLEEFLAAMFGKHGSYRYLGWLLRDDQGRFSLRPQQIDANSRQPIRVLDEPELKLDALGVEHGPVPALAYRVRAGAHTVVLSGDQNGQNPAFAELARGADVLVMHHAVPEGAEPVARRLHAQPSEIGIVAAEASVGTLVLSHHMQRSLDRLEQGRTRIAEHYAGPVVVAEDLMCIALE